MPKYWHFKNYIHYTLKINYTYMLCCSCWVTSVMSDSVRPHRQQPTRMPRPWDSPGKNTGVGCHFLLQCIKVKSESEVAQPCPTLSDPMDCSFPGSSIHGIFQARVLEWGAIALKGIRKINKGTLGTEFWKEKKNNFLTLYVCFLNKLPFWEASNAYFFHHNIHSFNKYVFHTY